MIQRPEDAKHNPFKSANAVNYAAFTIGAEDANIINVGIQFKDSRGNDCPERVSVLAYISDDAEGDDVTASAPTTVAIGTDGLAIPLVAGKTFLLTSEVDGDLDLNLTYAGGAATWYLNIVMPDGSIVTSSAIAFL